MALKQEITWTVLPNGIKDGKLNLSVFVTPRLSAPDQNMRVLGDFDLFFYKEGNTQKCWLDRLKELEFKLVIGNQEVPKERIVGNNKAFDRSLWGKLLHKEIPVKPFSFVDLSQRTIRSYPVRIVCNFLKNTYQDLAVHSPGELPKLQPELDENGNPIAPETTLDTLVNNLADIFSTKDIIKTEIIKTEKDGRKNTIRTFLDSDELKNNLQRWQVAPGSEKEKEIKEEFLLGKLYDNNKIPSTGGKLEMLNEFLLKITYENKYIIYYEEIGDWFEIYRYEKHYNKIDEILEESKVIDPDNNDDFESHRLAALQTCRFFDRRESDINTTYIQPEQPDLDFHQIHALLGDFPVVLRKLGFIIDMSVQLQDLNPNLVNLIEGNNTVKASLRFDNESVTSVNTEYHTPITKCFIEKRGKSIGGFYPASRENNTYITKGFLNVDDEKLFDLVQIDTDGAMIKLTNCVQNMQIPREYLFTLPITQTSPCKLQLEHIHESISNFSKEENVLSILNQIYVSVERSILTKTGPNVWQFTTGNRNYEIERTQSGLFHIFKKNKVAIDAPVDSGIPTLQSAGIMLAKTQRAWDLHSELKEINENNNTINTGNDVILFSEDLLRGYRVDVRINNAGPWYSLCQREGTYFLSLGDNENQFLFEAGDEGYIKAASSSSTDFGSDLYLHEGLFTWDGWSLVAPRPGRTIQTKEENNEFTEEPGVAQEKPYKDFPLLALFKAVEKSLPPLRFGHKYQVRVRAVDIAGNSRPLSTTQGSDHKREITYHRFEPVASPTLYPRKPFKEGEAAERMVIRTYRNNEGYPLTDETNERHVVPPKTSQLMAEKHGALDEYLMKGAFEKAYNISLREKGMLNIDDERNSIVQQDDLIIIENEQIQLPYLPDVLARGVVLQNVPIDDLTDLPDGITYVNDDALKIHALRIPFYDHNEKWPNAKPFRIAIEGKGTGITWDASERLLTILLEKAYKGKIRYSCYFHKENLELMGLWDWMKGTDNADELAKYALNGCHWMLTPYRELTLVHAVMRPLAIPKIEKISSLKEIGETFAYIKAKLHVNAKSTGKITLLSHWDDIFDNPEKDSGRSSIAKKAVAFECDVPEGSSDNIVFSEKDCTLKKHEFGDTRHRKVKYQLKAISRFTDCYIPKTNTDEEFTIEGNIFDKPVNILSSARPDVPSVNYIIPTFRWEQDYKQDKYFRRKRIGGGLRVYLDGPWYSSGDGELLGVVLANQDPHEAINSFITLWGMDPIRKSKEIRNWLTIADFDTNKSKTQLSLEEFMDKAGIDNSFDVAAFKPVFDKEKGLWYCDIQLRSEKIQSYFPFIKLALARYQPNSVKDAHLSNVVQSDFIQVSNDRELTVKFSAAANHQTGNGLDVSLEGYGPNYGEHDKPIGNDVEISIERQNDKSEMLWETMGRVIKLNLSFEDYFCKWYLKTPLTLPTANGKYRLVVKEFEKYKTGNKLRDNDFLGRRMVYTDILRFTMEKGVMAPSYE